MDKKWSTLLAVCLGTFMLLLDVTIVNVALPDIQRSLHGTFSDLQWVVDAYALSLASLLLTGGSLADMYGRRALFSLGLVIFTAGSLLCGLATSSLFLIVARAAQGVGGAVMFATALALLAHAFQGRERGVAFGIWGAITGIAVAIGPVLGGIITSGLTWRWIFLVNVPIGVFAVIVTLIGVEESRLEGPRPDWFGFIFFTTALISLVYALIRAEETSWTNSVVLICFAVAAVLLIAFLWVEAKGTHPMFDLSLFRKPTFAGGSIAAFGMSASIFALLLYIVIYLQDDLGLSALATGLRLLVLSGGILVVSWAAGWLSARVPVRWLIGPGLVLIGIGLILMAGVKPTSTWSVLIPGFVVAGIGVGFVNPPLASTAVGVVEPQRAGMASGINSTFRQVGIATGIAALGSVFATHLRAGITSGLSGTSALSGHASLIASQVSRGDISHAIASAPPQARTALVSAVRSSFASSLDEVLYVGAIVALVSGLAALALIRTKDFTAHAGRSVQAGPTGADKTSGVGVEQ